MMRRVVIPRTGDPTVLRVETAALPEPGPGELRIRVAAAGVARADVLMRSGHYPGRTPDLPFTPGWDVAGTVDAIGPGAPAGWGGRRVVALTLTGGHAGHVSVPASAVVEIPQTLSWYAAASLPLNHVTAYELLHHVAGVRPGERVLVHGASGGVGLALLDLGRLSGADMYGVTTDPALIGDTGATPVPRGASLPDTDVVLDPIGGATSRASWQALRPGGRLVSFGFLGGGSPVPDLLRIRAWNGLPNGRRASFYRLSTAAARSPGRIRDALAAVLTAGLPHRITAPVPLDDVAEAHRLVDRRPYRKVLLIT